MHLKNISMPNSWRRGFEAAAAISEHSTATQTGYKMGAAMFSGSILVSVGANLIQKTHPDSKFQNFNVGVHAEHSCLLKRRHYEDRNLTVYVYRQQQIKVKDTGKNGCSKPCLNCQALLSLAGVRRVRYINENGQPEEMKIR